MIDSLVEKLEKKVVLADGAMGTYFSQKYMTEMEAEEANIATPERIIAIHKEYIEAGAELIRTNTFAVNHGLFAEAERRKEVIEAAVANAREAVRQSRKEVVVAASVGPIRQSAEEEDGEIWKEYTQMLDVFYTLGIRVFLFETFSELRWLPKLAKYCKNKEEQTVVIAELALNPMGYTQHGFGMTEILQELTSDVNFDIVGFNCGVGALHMKKLLQSQKFPKEFLLSVFPNAGYQQEMQGRTQVFHDTAYYAGQMKEILALGANLVGGCCGTTPEHIKKLVEECKDLPLREIEKKHDTIVSSYGQAVILDDMPRIIGERINPTGKKKFKEALKNEDMDYILKEAITQQDKGAHILDVNVGLPDIDEVAMMEKVVKEHQGRTS